MTEAQWLACTDPRAMLEFLDGRASDRKLRLFACGCCRRIWHLLLDQRCRRAVLLAEASAEGRGGIRRLRRVESAGEYYMDHRPDVPEERLGYHVGGAIFQLGQERLDADVVADATAGAVACAALDAGGDPGEAEDARHGEATAQGHLLRCVFGNPFHPAVLNPAWLEWQDGTVAKLADTIYADRAFDRLPILADALEEAGCTDADLLGHCRHPGPHVRGCWVLDLVLGKR